MSDKIALFPGSFDPFTRGHEDILLRGLKVFDKVIIAIGHNSNKRRYFDLDLIKSKIENHYINNDRIEVMVYEELTAQFAEKVGAKFLLRGLRNTTDFEYENSIAQVNHDLNTDLETIFMITAPDLAFINSTIIREVHKYGGNVKKYLPFDLD